MGQEKRQRRQGFIQLATLAAVFVLFVFGVAGYFGIPIVYRGILIDRSLEAAAANIPPDPSAQGPTDALLDELVKRFDENGLTDKLQRSIELSTDREYRQFPYRDPKAMLRRMVTLETDPARRTLTLCLTYREILQLDSLTASWAHREFVRRIRYTRTF